MQSSYNMIPDIPLSLYTSHLNILVDNTTSGGTIPLWQSSEQEYYEVEIHSDRNCDADLLEKDIGEIINVNKYTCHICNILVPNMYVKEHNKSLKHITCVDIANIALERTKHQIQLDVASTRKIEVQNIFFCEPCSAVFCTSDKETHKQTKEHKISAKHDELLIELLKIYTDINNVEIETEIDELELLKQRIEAQSLLEESLLEQSGSSVEECHVVDTNMIHEEVFNALAIDMKSVFEEEFQHLSDDFNNKAKILQESMHFCHKSLDTIKSDSERIKNNIDIMNKGIDDLSHLTHIPVKKHSKNKALKKYQIKKKKEQFHRGHTLLDNAAKSAETVGNLQIEIRLDQTEDKVDSSHDTVVPIEETVPIGETAEFTGYKNKLENEMIDTSNGTTENPDYFTNKESPSVNTIKTKIDKILAKYFDKNRTVDALNIKKSLEHKNKVTKKNRKLSENQVDQAKQGHEDDEIVGQNNICQEQEAQKDQDQENINEDISEQEDERNIEKVQNKDENKHTEHNNIMQNKITIKGAIISEEHNNNYSMQNKNTDSLIRQNEIQKPNNTEAKCVNQADKSIAEPVRRDKRDKTNDPKVKKENKNIKSVEPNSVSLEPVKAKIKTPSFSLIYYLKDISRRCQTEPIHSVEAVTDNIVQITAINGDKIKVLINNFHSFHVKAQDIHCKVCEATSVRRREWHIIENDHRAKVMIPVHDRNGIRQLDDIWSHCILCNDLTKNIDFHIQSLLHKNKVKHCLVELGNNDNSDHHEEYAPIKNEDQEEIKDLITKNSLAVTNKNYLNCVICDVIVNNDLVSVTQHISSFTHLNNFEQLCSANKLVDVNDDKFYCIPCDVNVSKFDVVSHCKGAKHKKLLPETLKKFEDETTSREITNVTNGNEIVLSTISQNIKHSKSELDASELICFVCNIIIYCVDEHMDSFEHKRSYFSYLEANKLNEIEADTFYCIPCNTVITIDYLMSHSMSRKHKIKLHNIHGTTDVHTDKTDSDKIENNKDLLTPLASTSQINISSNANKKIMPLKILYQFKEMMDSTKLLCMVCDEEIYYSRKLAEYHVSTLDHVVAFNLMMLWNKIKKRDDRYFCDICRLDMTYFSEITHVLGKQHASNLAKEPKGTVYEYDRTLVTHTYAMSHKVGNRTRLRSVVSTKKL